MLPLKPIPTTALMFVGDTTVKEVALVLPNLTAVTPLKLVPKMDTVVPVIALVGVNELIVGGGM